MLDMTTVLIDDSVNLYDEVIIYKDVKKRAKELNISAYQLFTSITTRVPRIYIEKNKKTEINY